MTVGELFLESIATGVITPAELNWITTQQPRFSRVEEAAALRLGRLLDQGDIQLGCRLPAARVQHDSVREHWIEPLGRRRRRRGSPNAFTIL
ncbi:hypothetical protein [Cyanobium sp. CH-040]|uniref:hypothetical protein n=1 Tax=Cyanobium sp. CH-040 TaxID=2823708 RepID=UPI0020CD9A6B|nr:hypothetical protein [Cyanobium sp. CH-040]MCP9928102.1 hypothetical protein [Cyanobium sp. CH-040]